MRTWTIERDESLDLLRPVFVRTPLKMGATKLQTSGRAGADYPEEVSTFALVCFSEVGDATTVHVSQDETARYVIKITAAHALTCEELRTISDTLKHVAPEYVDWIVE